MENNIYRHAQYLLGAHTIAQLPSDNGKEVAFAGRSNVGKSSVLNTIADRKGLARISKTPGRTQLINFFSVAEGLRLVDLPGHGYAKVPVALKNHWAKTLNKYFVLRQSLKGLMLIVDIRRELTDFDRQMLDWCQASDLAVHILLNKADKLSRGAANRVFMQIKQQVDAPGISVQLFSALKKTGVQEARLKLDHWLESGKTEKDGPGL